MGVWGEARCGRPGAAADAAAAGPARRRWRRRRPARRCCSRYAAERVRGRTACALDRRRWPRRAAQRWSARRRQCPSSGEALHRLPRTQTADRWAQAIRGELNARFAPRAEPGSGPCAVLRGPPRVCKATAPRFAALRDGLWPKLSRMDGQTRCSRAACARRGGASPRGPRGDVVRACAAAAQVLCRGIPPRLRALTLRPSDTCPSLLWLGGRRGTCVTRRPCGEVVWGSARTEERQRG